MHKRPAVAEKSDELALSYLGTWDHFHHMHSILPLAARALNLVITLVGAHLLNLSSHKSCMTHLGHAARPGQDDSPRLGVSHAKPFEEGLACVVDNAIRNRTVASGAGILSFQYSVDSFRQFSLRSKPMRSVERVGLGNGTAATQAPSRGSIDVPCDSSRADRDRHSGEWSRRDT